MMEVEEEVASPSLPPASQPMLPSAHIQEHNHPGRNAKIGPVNFLQGQPSTGQGQREGRPAGSEAIGEIHCCKMEKRRRQGDGDRECSYRTFYELLEEKEALGELLMQRTLKNGGNPPDIVREIQLSLLGRLRPFASPLGGRRPIVYADWTASGRSLRFIEDFMCEEVMPFYGNTHTTTSVTGLQTTLYRQEARHLIAAAINAHIDGEGGANEQAEDVLFFCGSGSTGAVMKLIHVLRLNNWRQLQQQHRQQQEKKQHQKKAQQQPQKEREPPHQLHLPSPRPSPRTSQPILEERGGPEPAQYEEGKRTVEKKVNGSSRPHHPAQPSRPQEPHQRMPGCGDSGRPVIFSCPFGHHSNMLPWRETGCKIVNVKADGRRGLDMRHLELMLRKYQHRFLKIGAFTAASNITGICLDVPAITALLHRYGALAFWDYATAAPYLKMDMNASSWDGGAMLGSQGAARSEGEEIGPTGSPQGPRPSLPPNARPNYKIDALYLSGHKLVGGPGTPGVLVVKKFLVQNDVPERPGGGTVFFVKDHSHRYLSNQVEREEGGTPDILGSIRLGLCFGLKERVGATYATERCALFAKKTLESFCSNRNIVVLGDFQSPRLPIFSFLIRHGPSFLHYNFVCALLNDLFGIQSRGGCQCAGPYGQSLLGLSPDASDAYEQALLEHLEVLRPGFSRLSLTYYHSDPEVDYIISAVHFVADHGSKFLPFYRCNERTGEWRYHTQFGSAPGRRWLASCTYGMGRARKGGHVGLAHTSGGEQEHQEQKENEGKERVPNVNGDDKEGMDVMEDGKEKTRCSRKTQEKVSAAVAEWGCESEVELFGMLMEEAEALTEALPDPPAPTFPSALRPEHEHLRFFVWPWEVGMEGVGSKGSGDRAMEEASNSAVEEGEQGRTLQKEEERKTTTIEKGGASQENDALRLPTLSFGPITSDPCVPIPPSRPPGPAPTYGPGYFRPLQVTGVRESPRYQYRELLFENLTEHTRSSSRSSLCSSRHSFSGSGSSLASWNSTAAGSVASSPDMCPSPSPSWRMRALSLGNDSPSLSGWQSQSQLLVERTFLPSFSYTSSVSPNHPQVQYRTGPGGEGRRADSRDSTPSRKRSHGGNEKGPSAGEDRGRCTPTSPSLLTRRPSHGQLSMLAENLKRIATGGHHLPQQPPRSVLHPDKGQQKQHLNSPYHQSAPGAYPCMTTSDATCQGEQPGAVPQDLVRGHDWSKSDHGGSSQDGQRGGATTTHMASNDGASTPIPFQCRQRTPSMRPTVPSSCPQMHHLRHQHPHAQQPHAQKQQSEQPQHQQQPHQQQQQQQQQQGNPPNPSIHSAVKGPGSSSAPLPGHPRVFCPVGAASAFSACAPSGSLMSSSSTTTATSTSSSLLSSPPPPPPPPPHRTEKLTFYTHAGGVLGPQAIQLVQSSFEVIKPAGDAFCTCFYDRLFSQHPELETHFRYTDMKHQHASLLSALVLVIQELLDPSSLRSRLLQLGKRHFYYGASPAHYGHVGAAMLWALSTHLGERMTQEIHEAWSDTITFIATVMIEGGKLEEEAVNLAQEESEREIRRLKEEAEMAQTMVKESHATT